MGGKTATTTQQVQIPPEVLARYNAVNARAEETARQPFQQYGGQFVAPLTPVQQQGVQQASQAATLAQPFYGAATGLTMSGAQDVGPLTQGQIGYYENPYTAAVAAPTYQALRQQQGQELAQQQANAIRSGAGFGERSGLERANLMRQQTLGTAQALAPIFQQGYGQAVQTAAGQQGVVAADLARRMQAGQAIAGLGTGAQQAALQGAQGALQAGTAQQQTQQADLTARYQQFLQERGYDFQVAQFLANIAMGTGALSGSTTTTTQPQSFFSDRRLKHDVKEIGKTNDGLPIYSFKYNGNDQTQIGLMAQDVEKKKPEAVGVAAGFKTVDYEKATEGSDRKKRDLGGATMGDLEANSMGGAVNLGDAGEGFSRGGYAIGGGLLPASTDFDAILARIGQPIGMYGQEQGLAKGSPYGGKAAALFDPSKVSPISRGLVTAGSAPRLPSSGFQQALSGAAEVGKAGEALEKAYDVGRRGLVGAPAVMKDGKVVKEASRGLFGSGDEYDPSKGLLKSVFGGQGAYRGGVIRHPYADGGAEDSDPTTGSNVVNPGGILGDVLESQEKQKGGQPKLQTPGAPGAPPPGAGGQALSALGSIGSAATGVSAIMKFLPMLFAGSDARLKQNIRPVGQTFDGQNIYAFNMGNGPTGLGLIAQEVMQHKPEAVGREGKYLTVNYDVAVEDAVPKESTGLVPRDGFADGGPPGESADRPIRAEGLTGSLSRFLPSQVEKRDGKYVEDLDVKKTLVPLLTGLAGMAASPSRYLGSAVLQGLGAGAQSYANLEKQQQEIEESKAREQQGLAAAAKTVGETKIETPVGYIIVGFDPRTRQPIYRRISDLVSREDAPPDFVTRRPSDVAVGRVPRDEKIVGTPLAPPTPQAPVAPGTVTEETTTERRTEPAQTTPPVTAATTTPEAVTTPAATGTTPAAARPTGPIVPNYGDERTPFQWDIVLPKQLEDSLTGASDPKRMSLYERVAQTPAMSDRLKEETKKVFDETSAAARDSLNRQTTLNQTAIQLGRIPGEGALTAGAGFGFRQELANIYNTIQRGRGKPDEVIDPAVTDAAQIIKKINTLGSVNAEAQAGLRAASIAQAINAASPSGEMSRDASAQIMAVMYVESQKERDFARFLDKYARIAGTGYGAREEFSRIMGAQYEQGKKALSRMIREEFNPTGNRRFNMIEVLTTSPQKAREIEKKYNAPGISRYFIGG